jgi:hypothetical protein
VRPDRDTVRKRALNVAMHLRPRHRRWVEDLVDLYDREKEERIEANKALQDFMFTAESRGWLQELSKEMAERDRLRTPA